MIFHDLDTSSAQGWSSCSGQSLLVVSSAFFFSRIRKDDTWLHAAGAVARCSRTWHREDFGSGHLPGEDRSFCIAPRATPVFPHDRSSFSVSSLIHCLWKTVCTSFPPWRPRFSKPRFRPLCRVPPAQAGVRVGGMSQSQDEPAPRQYSLEQGFVAKVVFDIGRACSKTMACSELCDHAVEKRGQMGQPSESLTKSKKLGH